jgi:HK97 family phage major capsid protein
MEKVKMRSCERKSIARYRGEFATPLQLGIVSALFGSRAFKPVLFIMALCLGTSLVMASGHNQTAHAPRFRWNAGMASTAPVIIPQEMKEALEKDIKGLRESLGTFTDDAQKQIKATGAMAEETKGKIDKTLTEIGDFKTRLKDVEDHITKSKTLGAEGELQKSLGQVVIESEQFKDFTARRFKASGKIEVPSFGKTAIVNATGLNQPLVPQVRVPGIFDPLVARLTVRDLLNTVPTVGNLITFVKESSKTSAAAPQGAGSSPQVYENVAKAESALAFSLQSEPVQTLAHWIPASVQVLDDAPQLAGYINGRMTYMLKLKEESELLNGTGTGGDLNGLTTQATVYDDSLDVSGDTDIDTIRRAMLQAELAFASVNGIVLHPTQWAGIETIKTTGSASSGQYIFGNPHTLQGPSLWGRPVVSTASITAGHFLLGDFKLAADIYDRQQSSIEISREHSDFFVKNMVAILCEERLALVVYRPGALIYGPFEASE